MAAFTYDETSWNRLDFALLRGGGVTLYYSETVLAEDLEWLRQHDYLVREFDCDKWVSEHAFHDDIAVQLGFPEYYGRNLNALSDCLGDLEVPDRGGLAIIIRGVESVKLLGGKFMWTILDIFAGVVSYNLLFGRRLLVLAQSRDPRITFEPVGAVPVAWNPREWPNAKRGV